MVWVQVIQKVLELQETILLVCPPVVIQNHLDLIFQASPSKS